MDESKGIDMLKEELHALYEKKRLLEELVTECVERLESSGVGLDTPLVDSEVGQVFDFSETNIACLIIFFCSECRGFQETMLTWCR